MALPTDLCASFSWNIIVCRQQNTVQNHVQRMSFERVIQNMYTKSNKLLFFSSTFGEHCFSSLNNSSQSEAWHTTVLWTDKTEHKTEVVSGWQSRDKFGGKKTTKTHAHKKSSHHSYSVTQHKQQCKPERARRQHGPANTDWGTHAPTWGFMLSSAHAELWWLFSCFQRNKVTWEALSVIIFFSLPAQRSNVFIVKNKTVLKTRAIIYFLKKCPVSQSFHYWNGVHTL